MIIPDKCPRCGSEDAFCYDVPAVLHYTALFGQQDSQECEVERDNNPCYATCCSCNKRFRLRYEID